MSAIQSVRGGSVYFSRAVRWTWSDGVLRVALTAVVAGVVSLGAPPCSAAGDTALLRVHYPAGPHAVTVRGSAGGLSWTLGQPTSASASGDTFTYALVGLTAPAEWKPLLDDATWSRGPNYHVAPGQTVDVWPHFTTTHGQVVTLIPAFHSTVLGNDRPIYAYLPASYDENTDATYPVVYMHDGQNLWAALPQLALATPWNVDSAFDAAAESGACSAGGVVGWGAQPLGGAAATCIGDGDCLSGECRTFAEAIVIGVANNANRIYEYTPTTDPVLGGGGADGYVQMLAGELKPTIDATLRTRPGVGSTAIAGSSLGGLVSAYAALQRPDVYGLVAEFSPSTFWNGDVIVSEVAGTLPAPARPQIVYVDSGEGAADDQADTDLLAAQYLALGYVDGVNFRHVVQSGASHSEVFWAERFPGAMQLLLGGRSLAATTTTLAASASPAIVGQPTTFTATVAPVSDARAPSGSVTFRDGAASLGSQPLSGGQAALIVSTLTVGAHVITAAYGGDSVFSGSSAVLNEQVQGASCIGNNPAPCTASDQCHVAGVCDQQTGSCSNPTAADGTACSDGNSCTRIDTCQGGICTGSNTIVCTASDQCHVAGVCDAGSGLCSNPPAADGGSCDDGQFCDGQDVCFGGNCTHQGNPCKGRLCDPNSGACVECVVGSDCPSGICSGGVCGCATDQVNCGGVCRNTSTDPTNCGVCGHVCPAHNACVGGACQAVATCTDGVRNGNETDIDCGGGCPRCVICRACLVDGDCASQTCTAGVCQAAAATCCFPDGVQNGNETGIDCGGACTACPTGQGCLTDADCADNNPCTTDTCVTNATGTGICSNPTKSNGAVCSDGNACTQNDTCQAGACVGANPVVCTAPDQCHVAGTCDTGTGVCSSPAKANGTSCSDGNACTQTDTCQNGTCTGSNYSWSGVLQPVNADGSSVFKLGSTIPVKFKLTGTCAGNTNVVATIYFYQVTSSEGPVNEAESTSAADTGTVFRYSVSDDQYIFNLGTKGLTQGSWNLGIDLHDGVGIRVVTVGLRK